MSRKIDDCVLELREAWAKASTAFNDRNRKTHWVILTQTHRSNAVQAAYYAQGRLPLDSVNRLRKVAAMAPIKSVGNIIITQKKAGTSKHNRMPSEAFDVAMLQNGNVLNWSPAMFAEFAKDVKAANASLVWGGDWDSDGRSDDERWTDFPHFQTK